MGNKTSKTKESQQRKGKKQLGTGPFTFESEKSFEFSFYIQTPPIFAAGATNQIILFYTNYIGAQESKYVLFDLNKSEIISESDIKCDADFDTFSTVYALNEKENKIYFIENNKVITALDLQSNEIVPLMNVSIETTNENCAVIKYSNEKMYIFGAEQKTENDSDIIMVPYSGPYSLNEEKIEKFGEHSRVLNVTQDASDSIFIAGGQTDVGVNKRVHFPSEHIWKYDINTGQWSGKYLVQPLHSNGIINYQNRYLFLFGGQRFKAKKLRVSDVIYALPLKDGEFKLEKNVWYELIRKLPKPDHFHAMHIAGDTTVHLFSYSGLYYKLDMECVLDELEVGVYTPVNDDDEYVPTNGVRRIQSWNWAGKDPKPDKSYTVVNMGTKQKSANDEQKEQV